MALIALTAPDGKPVQADFQLIENVTLKDGRFRIETSRTVYKAGNLPRKEPMFTVVQEDLETILGKIEEYEKEHQYNIDLFKAKQLLRKAKEE